MSVLDSLPELQDCGIEFFDDNGNVIFKIDALGNVFGLYNKSSCKIINNKLLPYIQHLRGNIIALEEELKNK